MEAYIILGFLLGFPLLIGVLFRVSTSFLFVTILAAELLERYFRYDVELVLRPLIGNETIISYVGFVMLVVPMLLTGIFLKGTLSLVRVTLHVVPLVLSGVVFAAFAAPVLPQVVQAELRATEIGQILLDNAQFIVGVTVMLQLLALWFLTKKKEAKKTDKK